MPSIATRRAVSAEKSHGSERCVQVRDFGDVIHDKENVQKDWSTQ